MEHLSHLEKFTTPTWVTKDISIYIYNPYKELFHPHNWFSGAHLVDSEACSMLAFVLPALLHFRRKDRGDASRGKQPTNGKLEVTKHGENVQRFYKQVQYQKRFCIKPVPKYFFLII